MQGTGDDRAQDAGHFVPPELVEGISNSDIIDKKQFNREYDLYRPKSNNPKFANGHKLTLAYADFHLGVCWALKILLKYVVTNNSEDSPITHFPAVILCEDSAYYDGVVEFLYGVALVCGTLKISYIAYNSMKLYAPNRDIGRNVSTALTYKDDFDEGKWRVFHRRVNHQDRIFVSARPAGNGSKTYEHPINPVD